MDEAMVGLRRDRWINVVWMEGWLMEGGINEWMDG